MTESDKTQITLSLVKDRHNELKSKLDSLFSALVSEDKSTKISACEACHRAVTNLLCSVPQGEIPDWLNELSNWCDWYQENYYLSDANSIFIHHLMNINELLKHFKWNEEKTKTESLSGDFALFYNMFHQPQGD